MSEQRFYLRDGAAIYARSFAIIRAEADLSGFSAEEAEVAVRMIHACGQVEAARHIVFGHGVVAAARAALAAGAPIFCDAAMVAHGITRARLPANNEVVCTLRDARAPALAEELGTTRSAAALELWGERLAGGVVRSAMRRPRCSACSSGSRPARRRRPRSSASRSASSARPNRRKRSPPIGTACPGSSCAAAWAVAR